MRIINDTNIMNQHWTEEKIIEELEKAIDELGHFPLQKELSTTGRGNLLGAISTHGGVNKFRELLGVEIIKAPTGFWTKEQTLSELKKTIKELGHFPTNTELREMERTDLQHAIYVHGGTNKLRELFGVETIQKPAGYWTDETILIELKKIQDGAGYLPTYGKLQELGYKGLIGQIDRHGGMNKFRELLGVEIIRVPAGHWTEEMTLKEIKKISGEIGHFPTWNELKAMERSDLQHAINRNGSYNKFRELLGEKIIQASADYWTDETIIEEMKKIKGETGHFPAGTELRVMGRQDIENAMYRNGGIPKFRKLLGDELNKAPNGYWTEETIITELKELIVKISHFPTQEELNRLERNDLTNAIRTHGGINKFRAMFGLEPIIRPVGYWTDNKLIDELNILKTELGHFPTAQELRNKGQAELIHAMYNSGGLLATMERMGFPISEYEKHRAEVRSYVVKRGKKTEKIVVKILEDWCKEHKKQVPEKNVKLTKDKIIEFVCNAGRKIGIDVTNTESKGAVYYKWTKKEYQAHLDELWVVVFSDVFTDADYVRWNDESPDNVKVMSVYDFLKELDYAADEALKCKIGKYCECSFRTKDQLKIHLKQRRQASIEDYL